MDCGAKTNFAPECRSWGSLHCACAADGRARARSRARSAGRCMVVQRPYPRRGRATLTPRARFRTMKLLLITLTSLLLLPAAAFAAANHRGEVHHVCAASTWVERAPADHPIGVAFKGDDFRVNPARYHVARHESWARGVLVHHDKKSGKTFTYRGWIRVAALRGC